MMNLVIIIGGRVPSIIFVDKVEGIKISKKVMT